MVTCLQSLLVTTATAGLIGELALYGVVLVGAFLHYVAASRRNGVPLSLNAFGHHLVPRPLLRSRWTRLDIGFYFSNKLLFAVIFPSVAGMAALAASMVQRGLDGALGAPLLPQTTTTLVMFLIGTVVLRDFAAFSVHYLQHRVPLMWEFHKVHHAPESLIPPTGRRLHPFDQFPNMITEALTGLIIGAYAWPVHEGITDLIVYWIGVYALVNMITFSPLRHSHIDLRLGILERFLLSPAHHLLHHSVELSHWDKNFGAVFSVWDWMSGTLLEPPPADTYRLGLPNGESFDYFNLTACYVAPFRKIGVRVRARGVAHMLHLRSITPPIGASSKLSNVEIDSLSR